MEPLAVFTAAAAATTTTTTTTTIIIIIIIIILCLCPSLDRSVLTNDFNESYM